MSTVGKVIVAVVITALITGGSTYWYVNNKAVTDKAALQNTIDGQSATITSLNKKVVDLTPASTTPATPSTTPLTTATCQSSSLAATLTNASGAAGTFYYTLGLKNTGSSSCNYSGSTTVSILDKNGAALGSTSVTTIKDLSIAADQSINAAVGFPNYANYAGTTSCKAGATTLAVYPPNQTTAVTVINLDKLNAGYTDYYCSGFSVQAFSSTKP